MSGELEKLVPGGTLTVVGPDKPAAPVDPEARAKRLREREERLKVRAAEVLRWKAIAEAGGIDAWVLKQLAEKGLTDPGEGASEDKASYKERKKNEAREKRALKKLGWQAYRSTHIAHLGAGIYWQDKDDEETTDKDARLARAKQNDLSDLDSIEKLATGLGVDIAQLRNLAFHKEAAHATHYNIWTIPKRDGSRRTITAPKAELKAAQRWLLRNIVEKLPIHRAAHGFLVERSIVTNAMLHAGADVIVKVDVKDFFPTVTFRRVKGLFRKAGLPEGVATLGALIATEPPREIVQFRGKTLYVASGPRALPQGAPTSPGITNAICVRLDRRVSGLARMFGFTFTRYADDLTFSFRGKNAPIGGLLHGVKRILESEGFQVHEKKTAVMRSGGRQAVTGIIVNKAGKDVSPVRVSRKVVRKLKAAIFNREKGRPGKGDETLAQLKGLAAFVYMADPKRGGPLLERIKKLEAAP